MARRAYSEYESERSPAERAAQLRKAIDLATDESLAKGVTTFEDAGSPFSTVDAIRKMAKAGELRMRLWMMLRASNQQLADNIDRYRIIGAGDGWVTVRAIKRAMDGALGSTNLENFVDEFMSNAVPGYE
jgi:predicted amidohydrolase YtcJ